MKTKIINGVSVEHGVKYLIRRSYDSEPIEAVCWLQTDFDEYPCFWISNSIQGYDLGIKEAHKKGLFREYKYSWGHCDNELSIEPLSPSSLNKPSLMTNLITTFKGLFTSEPQKTFQKAGVTDSNGTLTPDGTVVFMAYLLDKNDADFKATVVDAIIAAQDAEKK